jgi:protease PrsW
MIIEFFFYVFLVGVVIAALAYVGDRFEKEPLFRIFSAIILGIFSTVIVAFLHKILPLPEYGAHPGWGKTILVSYLSAGFLEEAAKLLFILFFVYKWEDFNEWYDGPLYCGLVGIGFSISENLGYMIRPLVDAVAANPTIDLDSLRRLALSSLVKYRLYPGHFLFGFIAGYFLARAKFGASKKSPAKERLSIVFGFVTAVLLHGTFNLAAVMGNLLVFQLYVLTLICAAVLLGIRALRKSAFLRDREHKFSKGQKVRLRRLLLTKKNDRATFGDVVFLSLIVLVCQFFVYFLNYFITVL